MFVVVLVFGVVFLYIVLDVLVEWISIEVDMAKLVNLAVVDFTLSVIVSALVVVDLVVTIFLVVVVVVVVVVVDVVRLSLVVVGHIEFNNHSFDVDVGNIASLNRLVKSFAVSCVICSVGVENINITVSLMGIKIDQISFAVS